MLRDCAFTPWREATFLYRAAAHLNGPIACSRRRNKHNDPLTEFGVDTIIAEDALTIPMNVHLGIVIVNSVLETGIGCLAHHHEFRWERVRFLTSSIDDLLHYAFPPPVPQIQHVVINSLAAEEVRTRAASGSFKGAPFSTFF